MLSCGAIPYGYWSSYTWESLKQRLLDSLCHIQKLTWSLCRYKLKCSKGGYFQYLSDLSLGFIDSPDRLDFSWKKTWIILWVKFHCVSWFVVPEDGFTNKLFFCEPSQRYTPKRRVPLWSFTENFPCWIWASHITCWTSISNCENIAILRRSDEIWRKACWIQLKALLWRRKESRKRRKGVWHGFGFEMRQETRKTWKNSKNISQL